MDFKTLHLQHSFSIYIYHLVGCSYIHLTSALGRSRILVLLQVDETHLTTSACGNIDLAFGVVAWHQSIVLHLDVYPSYARLKDRHFSAQQFRQSGAEPDRGSCRTRTAGVRTAPGQPRSRGRCRCSLPARSDRGCYRPCWHSPGRGQRSGSAHSRCAATRRSACHGILRASKFLSLFRDNQTIS